MSDHTLMVEYSHMWVILNNFYYGANSDPRKSPVSHILVNRMSMFSMARHFIHIARTLDPLVHLVCH